MALRSTLHVSQKTTLMLQTIRINQFWYFFGKNVAERVWYRMMICYHLWAIVDQGSKFMWPIFPFCGWSYSPGFVDVCRVQSDCTASKENWWVLCCTFIYLFIILSRDAMVARYMLSVVCLCVCCALLYRNSSMNKVVISMQVSLDRSYTAF